jgi:hypothetical protein
VANGVICGTVENICVHYTAASAALRWCEVDVQAVDRESWVRVVPLGPPQHRGQAGQELARREWLDDVVVPAGLQGSDLLVVGVHCGQHDQRDLAPFAHAAADVGAVWESELDDEGVWRAERGPLERIGGAARHVHVEAWLAQHSPQRQRAQRLVIAHEDPRPLAHPTVCRGARKRRPRGPTFAVR